MFYYPYICAVILLLPKMASRLYRTIFFTFHAPTHCITNYCSRFKTLMFLSTLLHPGRSDIYMRSLLPSTCDPCFHLHVIPASIYMWSLLPSTCDPCREALPGQDPVQCRQCHKDWSASDFPANKSNTAAIQRLSNTVKTTRQLQTCGWKMIYASAY